MHDGSFERRRKAHRLAFLRQHRCDSANRRKESHVQHAVGLIEDEHSQFAEIDELAAEVIFQASGSGDHQPRARADRASCLPFGQSAHDQRRGGELLAAQRVVLIHDLHGQFARGNEHQRRDSRRFFCKQALDDRNQERQRLAGSCLRGRQHVLAFQRLRDRRGLHRSRRRKFGECQPLLGVIGNLYF